MTSPLPLRGTLARRHCVGNELQKDLTGNKSTD
jgi:hypothetical protein